MHANAKITVRTSKACAFAIAATAIALSISASAAEPVAVWDGAVAAYNFSTLTRTVGGVTYELRSNSIHDTVTDSYIQLATANQEAAPTITASAGASNPFGNGGCTVVLKCSNMPVSYDQSSVNRALIALFDGSNKAMIGIKGNRGSGGFIWKGDNYGEGGTQDSIFSSGSQTIALTYSTGSGTSYYVNGAPAATASTLKSKDFKSPAGIAIGGLPVSDSTMFYGMRQMKILAVAVFDSTLGADEVSAYKFPSEMQILSGSVSVSVINALFGSASEISVRLADGATVNGDTTFNASKVHFICDGSFTIAPPAGNTAAFDFFGVSGKPVVRYSSMPTVSGSVFTSTTVPAFVTDSTQWSGVIYISGGSFTNFSSNDYGNESSVVRLGNVSGWLRAPGNYAFTNSVPVELVDVLTINNGNSANDSNPNRCTVFKKLSGTGYIHGGTSTDGDRSVIVIQDASEFTGNIGLQYKIIVFGDSMPSYTDNNKFNDARGSIWVMEGSSVTVNPASGNWWAIKGIKVYGELRAPDLGKFGDGTSINAYSTGTLVLTGNGTKDAQEFSTDFARVSGDGTVKYTNGNSTYWRGIPTNNFTSTLALEIDVAGGMVVPDGDVVIGSLTGTNATNARIFSNYGAGTSRTLRICETRDTEYAGVFSGADRIAKVYVQGGSDSTGTLKLSGTQMQSNNLVVEADGSVNLTGTWVGPITVYGSLSGTGTVDGDLTLEDGATINIDLNSPLDVKGKIIAGNDITINPRLVSLNGKAQSLERTLELVRMFGGDALSEDGVSFKLNGIDLGEGTLKMSVSPPVRNGTLSVMGKRELGDRWRRVRVTYGDTAYGTDMSIDDGDAADCRFFQIRAEFGEKDIGYTVRETPVVGDHANTESESHFTQTRAGGEAVLFSIALEDGADKDYLAAAYKHISFQLNGVVSGATATLATNGVITATAVVAEDGKVDFTGLPQLGDGTVLSVGVSTSDASGNIVTTNLSECAGALAYAWGDGEVVSIDGGVTNTMTMLAYTPKIDRLGSVDEGRYRIPAMAKGKNGLILTAYDCRYSNSSDIPYSTVDFAGNISSDSGKTWTKTAVVVDVSNENPYSKSGNISDPCMIYDRNDDKFYLMGITGGGLHESHDSSGASRADVVLYVRSGGKEDSWQEWTHGPGGNERSVKQMILDSLAAQEGNDDLKDENKIRGILQGPGHGFVQQKATAAMPEGTIVFPMQYFPLTKNWSNESRTFAAYSIDHGATWTATKLTDASVVAQENCIMELDDGSWYMIAKGQHRQLFRTVNYVDWKHVGSISPSCWVQGTCIRIGAAPDGKSRYVACFTVSTSPANRSHLTLHFGRDTTLDAPDGDGIAWNCGNWDIYPEETGGMSYNSLVMIDDSTLGVLFESRGHIYFRKVDVSALLK